MRVSVIGSSRVLPALRGNVAHSGYRVVDRDQSPTYTIRVEDAAQAHITVDIPDALFGRLMTHAIAGLAGGVFVQQAGGNQDDRAVLIRVPIDEASALAVERGVVRALDQTVQIAGESARRKRADKLAEQLIAQEATEHALIQHDAAIARGAVTRTPWWKFWHRGV